MRRSAKPARSTRRLFVKSCPARHAGIRLWLTDWWEAGFYLPFAVSGGGQFLSDGAKIRSLFVVPTPPSEVSFMESISSLAMNCHVLFDTLGPGNQADHRRAQ